MDYEIEIKKTLISDNGKRFRVGSDIAFTLFNQGTKAHDKYIGEIRSISSNGIVITNIEVNRKHVDGYQAILFSNIEPNSCNYVSVN